MMAKGVPADSEKGRALAREVADPLDLDAILERAGRNVITPYEVSQLVARVRELEAENKNLRELAQTGAWLTAVAGRDEETHDG